MDSTASSFTLRKNAKRAAEAMIRKGTAPAVDYGRCGRSTNLKSETGHGTQKPVECMRRPIENNASPGQAVYEPFSGSGTTIIAAEMIGRVCHAIEIAPAYVDVDHPDISGVATHLKMAGNGCKRVAT